MKAFLFMATLIFGWSTYSAEPEDVPAPKPGLAPAQLNKCKLAARNEESAVRDAAEGANFSDHEIFARLILAKL